MLPVIDLVSFIGFHVKKDDGYPKCFYQFYVCCFLFCVVLTGFMDKMTRILLSKVRFFLTSKDM